MPSTKMKMDYLTERRISQAEMERRYTWLQKARMSISATRDRCRITHEVRFPDNFNGLYSTRFSGNGEVIITCFGAGGIQIRSGETAQLKATLRGAMETSFPIMCCRFHPIKKNVFYTSGACGNIFQCTTDKNEINKLISESKNEVNTIDISGDGDYLVSAGKDAAVRIYDPETAKLIMTYQKTEADMLHDRVSRYHRMRIFAARFHHIYTDLIITGGWDDTVRIWDIRDGGGSVRTIKGPHICGDAIDFRETHILTGSWVVRESLQIWDLMSGKLIETIKPRNRPTTLEGEFLYTVQYFDGDPYGDHILTGGSGIGAVEVINIKEQKVIDSFKVNKPIVALDSSGTTIVYGGMESVIRLANVTPYTIRKTSLGSIRRVHRNDSNIKGPIVDWREENQRVKHTEDLENLRSSKNTNESVHFDLSSLFNVAKNITKADKTISGELTNHTRFKRGVIHLYNMVVCATGCNPLVYKGYGCYCGFLGSGYVIDGIDRCCKMHDWCYDATECPIFMEYIAPYYWRCYHGHKPVCAVEHGKWGGSGSCAQRLCECDRSLAECLRRYPCPTTKAVCTSSPWRLIARLLTAAFTSGIYITKI
ncbi:WD repeat-containing protein 5 [Vespula squamosa]|uniref:WD repeat-containing protein 5 n=1 Tax=Vespula squamosa TaxID=30214 RepID=A0ABD2AE58_VESSQ